MRQCRGSYDNTCECPLCRENRQKISESTETPCCKKPMSRIDEVRVSAKKIVEALKGFEEVELFLDDEDGSGFLEIDGVCFHFNKDKEIEKFVMSL